MKWMITVCWIVIFSGLVSSCASIPQADDTISLDDIIVRPAVVTFPHVTSQNGQLLVPVSVNGEPEEFFAIDTGATRSALFADNADWRDVQTVEGDATRIHGLAEISDRPVIVLDQLKLGHQEFANQSVAVLDSRHTISQLGYEVKGLIGLDILLQFRLYLDAENGTMNLIPKSEPIARKPESWKRVALQSNPYIEDGRALKFFMIESGGQAFPALLDSGSAMNFMNWEVAEHPKIQAKRRRLKKQWIVEGASGTFDPKVIVRLATLQSGDKYWMKPMFVVTDINSLNILGISGKPFAIAGVEMLAADSFYLDFANNELFIKDDNRGPRETLTGSRLLKSRGKATPGVLTLAPSKL